MMSQVACSSTIKNKFSKKETFSEHFRTLLSPLKLFLLLEQNKILAQRCVFYFQNMSI